ncbi:MAG: amino acid permease, partial [Caldilineaceae bacterium]|nr:amino acid permease [Caldilineaceae bacterium]
RQLGVFGAVMMGLGSIVGTGVFVSIGIGAGIVGPAVVLAIVIGALVATFNGLSSAQLAASHPVSGGTYEYGYKYLNHWLGFTAGWMFLSAKSASAATAALGFAGYLLNLAGVEQSGFRTAVAVGAVLLLTAITVGGIRRSNLTNIVIVTVTLVALVFFVLAGLPDLFTNAGQNFRPLFAPGNGNESNPWQALFHASALMFVAYTGYGRIATMGEEVRDPATTIPRAIITTLIVTAALYTAVGLVAVGNVGAVRYAALTNEGAAPLEAIAQDFALPGAGLLLAIGAMTAMLGVLLNLILGLSRVLLAMGRRGDMPAATARIDAAGTTPYVAVLVMGAVIALLALIGNVKTTWSFSAFTVLIYYALTNLAALGLPPAARRFPRWVAVAGVVACLFLAFWVEPLVWGSGLALLGVGLVWHWVQWRTRR